MNLTLSDVATLIGGASAVAGLLFWAALGKLGKTFASAEDHNQIEARVKALELRMDQAPDHDDFKAMRADVASVGLQMATMIERVDGLKGSQQRIEGTLKQFVEARLQWEKER